MNRETGKDRWRRVPKDYFKGQDSLQRAKLLFSVLAMVLTFAWFVSGVDWKNPVSLKSNDLNSLRANHGTLARAHSFLDNKCDACHVPFEPIDGRSLFASTSSPSNRSSDKLCMACHAGPAHHQAQIEAEVKTCAECHRDHQGRDFSLVRLNDNQCTNCHAELDAHVDTAKKPPNTRMYGKVSRFNEKDHPAFTPEGAIRSGDKLQDRGKLKFNHARHMTPGIVKKVGDTPYTAEKIPLASERARYQGQGKPSDPIQLDCASCHQLDPTEVRTKADPAIVSDALPARNPGQYYLPVTFEASCRGCHTLSFDPSMKDVEVPHGVQPDQVAEFLKRTYAAQALSDDPKFLDVFVPPVRLPGKAPSQAQTSARKKYDEAVDHALTFMFPKKQPGEAANSNNCLECHHYGKDEVKGIPTKVEPTNVPKVWFTHAAFDHTAHRGVSCRECHARSYAMGEDGKTPTPDASTTSADVLIPGIDNCVQCHAPSKATGGWLASLTTMPTTGGASFDCTECHRYHNGDQTLLGYGAPAQDATLERSIAEFLKGEGGRPAKSAKP